MNMIWMILIVLGILCFLFPKFYSKTNTNYPKKKQCENPHFAILIPARNESKVISGLLDSIQIQTFSIDMEDVYIIVETKDDPTVLIAKRYGANIIVRKFLELKRKGYALNEGFQEILNQKKQYDAYFIFDADNILAPTYLEEMKQTFLEGYDIGVGYRNSKNGNHNVITACSTLTFSMINTLGNESKNRNHGNVIVSGTGFYITDYWIQKWKGYPFHSLTEDYELYLYSVLHEMTSYYNTKAVFYDEQPTKFKQTVVQRTRWIKGFFSARSEYIPKMKKNISYRSKNKGSKVLEWMGIKPYLLIVIGAVGMLIQSLLTGIYYVIQQNRLSNSYFLLSIFILFLIYAILVLFTGYLIHREKDLNLNQTAKWKALFYNPFFLASYILCLIKALTQKEVIWVPIEHTEQTIEK